MSYNGYTWDQNVATIQELTGVGLPDIRTSYAVKSQQDGAVATGYRYGARFIGLKGHLKSSSGTPAAYLAERQELIYALRPTLIEGHTLTFTLITGDTRTIRYCRPTDGPFDFAGGEPSVNWNSYALIFRADFPFFEGTETDSTQSVTVISGGMAIPAVVPAPMSGSSSSSPYGSYTNAGNAPAYPVFTITGPGTNFTVTNRTNGQEFVISTTLDVGESIEIDTWNHTVTKNDGTNLLIDFEGDFITFDGGAAGATTSVAFSVDSGNTAATLLRVVFKNSYLNL